MNYSIAIDGPAGAGKSSIARELAERLKFIYVDTGAMYRTLAVYFIDCGYHDNDFEKIVGALDNVRIDIRYIDGIQHMFSNGIDVTDRLRTEDVSHMASVTSQLAPVRNKLTELQRTLAEQRSVIMDGRDIGTVILPNATLKIFLTAASNVRAMRRYLQLKEQNRLNGATPESIQAEIAERDKRDTQRENAPLKAADDAVIIDTSDLTIREVEDLILKALEAKIGD